MRDAETPNVSASPFLPAAGTWARYLTAGLSLSAAAATFGPWLLSLPHVFAASPLRAVAGVLVPALTLEVLRRARRAERDRGAHADARLAFFFRHAAFLFGCGAAWLRISLGDPPSPLTEMAAASGAWILPLTAFGFLWIWMRD